METNPSKLHGMFDILLNFAILMACYFVSLLFSFGGLGWFLFKPLNQFYPLDYANFYNLYGHGLIVLTVIIANVIAVLITTLINKKLTRNIYINFGALFFAYFLSYIICIFVFTFIELQMLVFWKKSFFDFFNFKTDYSQNKIFSSLLISILLYTISLGVMYNVFQNGVVNGESMTSTLIDTDQIKFDTSVRDYYRGDIVTAMNPVTGTKVIKRIIALEGEEVEILGAKVIVRRAGSTDDRYLLESYLADQQYIFQEAKYQQVYLKRTKVPQGSYFLMGDNRINSIDSREYGTVPKKDLIGVAAVAFSAKNDSLRTMKAEYGWVGLERAKYQFLPISPQEEERNQKLRDDIIKNQDK